MTTDGGAKCTMYCSSEADMFVMKKSAISFVCVCGGGGGGGIHVNLCVCRGIGVRQATSPLVSTECLYTSSRLSALRRRVCSLAPSEGNER